MKKSELIRLTVEQLNKEKILPKRARKYSFEIVKRVINGHYQDSNVLRIFSTFAK